MSGRLKCRRRPPSSMERKVYIAGNKVRSKLQREGLRLKDMRARLRLDVNLSIIPTHQLPLPLTPPSPAAHSQYS